MKLKKMVAVLLLIQFVCCSSFLAAAELVLREEVALSGTVVRLGDIAEISASESETLRQLSTTPLMPVPSPGSSHFLRRSHLRDLLASRGVDVLQLTFLGPSVVEISNHQKASVKVAEVPKNQKAQPKKAQLPIQKIIVALRNIERGELIRAADVEIRQQPGTQNRNAVNSLDQVVGMEARNTVREGSLIYKNQVRAPLQVKRGETVSIFASTGGISVKTFAIARQDGALGDLIQVQTLDKKEQFTAHVSGRRELEVYVPGKDVSEVATLERRSARRR